MARRRPYDAILIDRRLPKMSGDQVLEQLRQDGDRTPVLILTGYPDVESAFQAGRLQAAEYLVKGSLPSAQLAATVRRAASTNPRAARDVATFATHTVGASPSVRNVRSCLDRLAASPSAIAEQADTWRLTLAAALVRAAASQPLTLPEFVTCARALRFLYSSVRPSLDAAYGESIRGLRTSRGEAPCWLPT